MQEALHSTEKLYDIILAELRMTYECYFPIAARLNIPIIGTTTVLNWRPADFVVGMPHNPAAIPLGLLNSKPEMNFFERIQNVWNDFIVGYYRRKSRMAVEKFYQKYFSKDLLYKKDISIVFYNNHASLLPRSTPPNVIEIGGFHVQPAKPLPKVRF